MAEQPPALDVLVADAYRAASLAAADMHQAADDLEALKRRLAGEQQPLAAWRAVNAAIAAHFPDLSLAGPLASLRDGALALQLHQLRTDLDALAATDPDAACATWVRHVGEALAALWSDVLPLLGAWALDRPYLDAELGRLAVATGPLLDQQRFPEARALFDRLVDDERLEATVAAQLLVLAGQIEAFRVEDLAAAQRIHARTSQLDAHQASLLAVDIATKRVDWAVNDAERAARLEDAESLVAELFAAADHDPEGSTWGRRADLWVKRAALELANARPDGVDAAYAAALADYRAVAERDPWDGSAHRALAAFLVRRGDRTGEAEQRAELARILEPADAADTDAAMGAALLDTGRLDEARAAYERALAREPDNADVLGGYAAVLQATGDLDTADAVLEAAEARRPGSFDVARSRGWLAEAKGDWAAAVARHREALAMRPEAEAAVRADVAWALDQLGDGDGATAEADAACAALARSATAEGPALVPATSRLLDAVDRLAAAGRVDDALQRLDVVRALRGTSAEADYRNRRGVVLHDAGRWREAADEYRRAIDVDPTGAQYYSNLALALRRLGEYDEAAATIEARHRVDGDDAARDTDLALSWNDRANEAYSRSAYDEAVAYYRQAVALAPTDPVLVGNLAVGLDGLLAVDGAPDIAATVDEVAELYERAAALPDGGDYAEQAANARRRADAVRTFGPFVATVQPFNRVRVRLAPDVVDVFVETAADGQRVLRSSITDRLDTGRSRLGPYGLVRPGVRFDVDELRAAGSAGVVLNGRLRLDVPVEGSPEPVLAAVEDLLVAEPEALLGPDDVAGLVASVDGADRVDSAAITADPERLAALTRVLRERARDAVGEGVDEGVDVRSAIEAAAATVTDPPGDVALSAAASPASVTA